ncbi:unnamed protein product [Rhodiola kirilowii]
MELRRWIAIAAVLILCGGLVAGEESATKPLVKIVKGKKVCVKGWSVARGRSIVVIDDFGLFSGVSVRESFREEELAGGARGWIWDYHSFITAAAVYQPLGFGTTGNKTTQMMEVAAFLGHVGSKTSCGYGVATEGHWHGDCVTTRK